MTWGGWAFPSSAPEGSRSHFRLHTKGDGVQCSIGTGKGGESDLHSGAGRKNPFLLKLLD